MTLSNETTAFADALASFTAVADAAKADLARVGARLDVLAQDRQRVLSALPHTDDIVAALLRGLAAKSGEYERQLAADLQATYANVEQSGHSAMAVLPSRVGASVLSAGSAPADRSMVNAGATMPASLAAITYFLRDKIAAEIPGLVGKLLPSSGKGMTAAARREALQAIDEEIETLTAQAAQLQADLGAARAALGRGQG